MPSHPHRFTPIITVLVPALLLLAAGCRSPENDATGNRERADQPTGTSNGAALKQALVTAVIDGDTIDVEMGGRRHRVRLLGVDSPESVHPELPEQCYGKEATEALNRLLPPGTDILIERDIEPYDQYQRLLLYVYRRSDGLFVNRWLVEQGLAEAVFYPPNIHFRPEIQTARQRARASRQGLWGNCEGPDQPLR